MSPSRPLRAALAGAVMLAGGPADAQPEPAAIPPPRPPVFAPAPPAGTSTSAVLAIAAASASPATTVPAAVARGTGWPAMTPAAISRSMSREAHALLYRLDHRLQQFARDYNRPSGQRPSVQQLDLQLDEIEGLLAQLHRHPLPAERQTSLFKTEMNLRRLRESTVPNL